MKKRILPFLLLILLLTSSTAFANEQDAFFRFVDNLRAAVPEGFFDSEVQLYHSPFMKLTKQADEIFSDSEMRCNETALRFTEILILKVIVDQPEKYFGNRAVAARFDEPSYIGRDGNILNSYVPGPDCGFFMLYDLDSQLMYIDFVPLEVSDQVESVLFERCVDGHYTNDPDLLEEKLEYHSSYYDAVLTQFGL